MKNFDIELFKESEIATAFGRLSNKKSSGMDSLSGFFLKKFTTTLISPLTILFNKILATGKIPSTWKIARIMPVHKKGDNEKIENYRPISNIVSIAKLFEICILQRLEKLDQDFLVGTNQHGFRKKHGTDTAIAEVVHAISEGRDNKLFVGVYSADLTAAFDLLRKEKLVEIMIKKGVPKYLVKTIHSYLDERVGYVQIDEQRSCVRDIVAGCVQGSVIGPFLFNLYMSDLNEIIYPHKLVSYADDSYVIIYADNLSDLKLAITNTLTLHFDWLKTMGMKCNMSKTEIFIFDQEPISITVGDNRLDSMGSMKILGLKIDHKLNWKLFVEELCNKVRSLIFGMRYVRRNLSLRDTVKIVKAQIVSRLCYGCPVWFCSLNFNLRARLRSVYYMVIRTIIRDFNRKYNRNRMLKIAGMENIDNIYFKRISVFVYNIIYSLQPTNLAGIIISKSYTNERHPDKIFFFDTSSSKLGRTCITNLLKNYCDNWNFEWFGLNPDEFKRKLRSQMS